MSNNIQTRIITVTHPSFKDTEGNPLVLFKAHVQIVDINKTHVKRITKVNIEYDLKENN